MATRTLSIDGANGRVAITRFGNPAAVTNPLSNLDDVFFHTDLNYLQLKQTIGAVTVSLPYVARSYYTWSDGGGCGGGCYITTACVEVMGLEDDCYELQTLRKFRDKHMLDSIEKCHKVADYYFHAPKVVENLKAMPDHKEFLKDVYERFILKAVHLIEQCDYEGAMQVYEQGVRHCADKAGVTIG